MLEVLNVLFVTAIICVFIFAAMILLGGVMTLFDEIRHWLETRG